MRPVELRLSGIQSYRETQTIDFAAVIGPGLFGIFGPTGSGKSTILDAITLALYGEVTRAPRGTQGIVNLSDSAAEVAFTFELRDGGRVLRYRAERRYLRAKVGGGVRSATCRLVDLTDGGTVVLADKADDMTRRVVSILGLEADDFTRAVVLPQGRFAEFLHLRGAPRREMLQRLFDLGRYGQRLGERLKAHTEALATRQTGLEAELVGIGDASAEAVAGARAATVAAAHAVTVARDARQAAQDALAAVRAIRALESELGQARATLGALEEGEETFRALAARVDGARRAEALRDVLAACASARLGASAASARRVDADAAAERARETAALAALRLSAWEEQAALERPALEARARDLFEAEALEGEIEAGRDALRAAERAAAEAERERAAAEAALVAARARRSSLEAEQAVREGERARAEVPTDVRAGIAGAMAALVRVGECEARLARAEAAVQGASAGRDEAEAAAVSLRAEAEAAERAHAGAVAALEAERAERHPDEEALAREAGALEAMRAAWAECARLALAHRLAGDALAAAETALRTAQAEAEAALGAAAVAAAAETRAEAAVDRARATLEVARRQNMAAHLARELRPGGPCPVCGGLEHPRPAGVVEPEGELGRLEEALAAAEAALGAARAEARTRQSARAAAESALVAVRVRRAETESALAAAAAAYAAGVGVLPPELAGMVEPTSGAVDVVACETLLDGRAEALRAMEREGRRWRGRLEEARQAVDGAGAVLLEARQRGAGAVATLAARRATLAAAEEQRRAAAQDLEAAWAAFAAAAGGASAEGIEAEAERIARCDASLERLTGELRAGAAALAEARSAVEGAEGRLSAAATTAAALRLGHERLEGVALTLRARLTKLLGEEPAPAAAALARVQRALEALGAAGEALKRTAAEAVELSRQAELGSGEARALETSARSAADLAEEELGHRLAERGFRDEEAARTALMAAEELAVAEAELRQGQEARREAEAEIARLARELGGRTAPDEVLSAALRLAADADRREAEARERAGAASQVFEDLERRSIRWREVTAELARVRAEAATARDLQEALYGGRFIDFMAEEHLRRIAADGSARLAGLTRYRYALDLDSDGGFLVRDDHAGGQHRPATSLSGGETFLASLALALSLSAQIQLRGRFPLEFFFLDEGFGSLDPELLETVVTALEQLHMEHVHIGLITHVAELRSRVPARLIVEPAVSGGHGSRIRFEAG